jgi:hypothetical protein
MRYVWDLAAAKCINKLPYKTTDEQIPWDRIGCFYENEKARWNVYTRAVNDKQTLGQKNSRRIPNAFLHRARWICLFRKVTLVRGKKGFVRQRGRQTPRICLEENELQKRRSSVQLLDGYLSFCLDAAAAVQLLKSLQQSWLWILLKDEAFFSLSCPRSSIRCCCCTEKFGAAQSAAAACGRRRRWAKLLGRFHLGIRKWDWAAYQPPNVAAYDQAKANAHSCWLNWYKNLSRGISRQ